MKSPKGRAGKGKEGIAETRHKLKLDKNRKAPLSPPWERKSIVCQNLAIAEQFFRNPATPFVFFDIILRSNINICALRNAIGREASKIEKTPNTGRLPTPAIFFKARNNNIPPFAPETSGKRAPAGEAGASNRRKI